MYSRNLAKAHVTMVREKLLPVLRVTVDDHNNNVCQVSRLSYEEITKIKLDKKVCEQTLSWLAKAGPESFKKFGKF